MHTLRACFNATRPELYTYMHACMHACMHVCVCVCVVSMCVYLRHARGGEGEGDRGEREGKSGRGKEKKQQASAELVETSSNLVTCGVRCPNHDCKEH